jgi:hypothetical protein
MNIQSADGFEGDVIQMKPRTLFLSAAAIDMAAEPENGSNSTFVFIGKTTKLAGQGFVCCLDKVGDEEPSCYWEQMFYSYWELQVTI